MSTISVASVLAYLLFVSVGFVFFYRKADWQPRRVRVSVSLAKSTVLGVFLWLVVFHTV